MAFKISDFVDHMLILFYELASLACMRVILLVHLELVHLLLFLQRLHFLRKLLVICLKLLSEQGNLSILLCDCLLERLCKLLDLIVELILNLLSLLLLEENLIFVIKLSLR